MVACSTTTLHLLHFVLSSFSIVHIFPQDQIPYLGRKHEPSVPSRAHKSHPIPVPCIYCKRFRMVLPTVFLKLPSLKRTRMKKSYCLSLPTNFNNMSSTFFFSSSFKSILLIRCISPYTLITCEVEVATTYKTGSNMFLRPM